MKSVILGTSTVTHAFGEDTYAGFSVVPGFVDGGIYAGEGELFERVSALFLECNELRESFLKQDGDLRREIEGLEEKIEGMVDPFVSDEEDVRMIFAFVCAAEMGDMWLRYDVVDVDELLSDGSCYPSVAMENARDAMRSGAGAYRVLLTDSEFGDSVKDVNPRGLGYVSVSAGLPEDSSGVTYKLVYAGDLEMCEQVCELVLEIGVRERLKRRVYDERVLYTRGALKLYREIEELTGMTSLVWTSQMMEM